MLNLNTDFMNSNALLKMLFSLSLVFCLQINDLRAEGFLDNLKADFKSLKEKIAEKFRKKKNTEITPVIPEALATQANFTEFNLTLAPENLTEEKPDLALIPEPEIPALETTFQLREDMVEFSKRFLGLPYLSRKTGYPFDCSGFTSYVLSKFGYSVSRGCRTQATEGDKIDFKKVKKGDLLFFGHKRGRGNAYISHVGMVVSEEGEPVRFIHASRRGIVIDTEGTGAWKSYYGRKFLFATRVVGSEIAKAKSESKKLAKK
jgi:cell wall-associated NlpC family hydrolase